MKNNLKLIDGETGKEFKGRSKILRAKYIIIQDSVTSIGEDAFLFCDSLRDVHYNGTKHEFMQISKDFVNISSLKTIHCIDGDYSLIDQKKFRQKIITR